MSLLYLFLGFIIMPNKGLRFIKAIFVLTFALVLIKKVSLTIEFGGIEKLKG